MRLEIHTVLGWKPSSSTSKLGGSHITSLSLSFPICKMGIMRKPSPQGCGEDRTGPLTERQSVQLPVSLSSSVYGSPTPCAVTRIPCPLSLQLCPIVDVVLGLVNDQLGLVDCKCFLHPTSSSI